MGAFASGMQQVAKNLIDELGNSCTLTEVIPSVYDPTTGETNSTKNSYGINSAPMKEFNIAFGKTGENTNLTGFGEVRVIVSAIGLLIGKTVDTTWEYNGHNINNVEVMSSQDTTIAYVLTVGVKK